AFAFAAILDRRRSTSCCIASGIRVRHIMSRADPTRPLHSLAAGEFCRALLQERGDAFAEIVRCAGLLLELALAVELFLIGVFRALPVEPADQAERLRRAAREILGELARLAHDR